MDYQEAIKIIKNHYPTSNYTILREALDLAMDVLENRIPQKVAVKSIEVFNGEEDEYYCPRCDWVAREYYCPNCGQKLDWK